MAAAGGASRAVVARLRSETGKGLVVIAAGVGLSTLSSVVLAKLLSAHEFGIYVFAITILSYAAVLARGGLESTAVRFVNQYRAQSEPGLVRAFVAWADRAVTLQSGVLALAGIAIVLVVRNFVAVDATAVALACAGLVPFALVVLHTSLLRAEKRIVISQAPLQVVRPLGVVLVVGALAAAGLASGAMAVGAEVAVLAAMAWPLALITRHFRAGAVPVVPDELRRLWSAATRRTTVAAVSQQLIGQMDIILVGAAFGMREAGAYGFASRLAKLVILGNKAANSIAAPMTAETFHAGDRATMQAVVSETCTLSLVGTVVTSAVLLLIPASVFAWLGAGFAESRVLLWIFLIGQVVNSVKGPVGVVLLMTGNENAQTVINFVFGALLGAAILATAWAGGSLTLVAVWFSAAMVVSSLVKSRVVFQRTGIRSVPAMPRWRR